MKIRVASRILCLGLLTFASPVLADSDKGAPPAGSDAAAANPLPPPPPPAPALVDKLLVTAKSNDELWPASSAIDGNPGSCYSSQISGSQFNDRNTFLAAWMNGAHDISKVVLTARKAGDAILAFPTAYIVYVTSPDNTKWNEVKTFTDQPDANGNVVLSIGPYSTFGVMIVPISLGVDDYNNHYFQLCELQLLP